MRVPDSMRLRRPMIERSTLALLMMHPSLMMELRTSQL